MAKTITTPPLFPILQQHPTGIARMAAESRHADDGHLIEFKTLAVRSILNRTVSKRLLWMAYSINPYRGCEFGCRYCYARYTHEFMAPKAPESAAGDSKGAASVTAHATPVSLRDPEPVHIHNADQPPDMHDPLTFERLIFLKQNAAWLLEQELRRNPSSDEIAIGTATDPWQPIERRARITRSLLDVFARHAGRRIGLVTKSSLILRDTDLLQQIHRRNHLIVHITITTPDAALARLLEPRAPRPDLRFDTVRRLRRAGITTGILCSPLLPGITDTEEAINRMAALAAEANASFFAANPLFLKPCSRPTYLSFVREHFPHLVADYHRRFDHADFAARPYARHLSRLVSEARERHGLNRRQRDHPEDLAGPIESPTLNFSVAPPTSREPPPQRKPPATVPKPKQQQLFA
jgi:DNA repair photolyase